MRKRKPEIKGWRIITRHNAELDKTVYRVYREGFFGRYTSRPPQWEDFDTYADANHFYHDMVGWEVTRVEQP